MEPNQHPSASHQPVTAEVVGPSHTAGRSHPLRTMLLVLLMAIFVVVALVALVVVGFLVANALLVGSSYDAESRVQEQFYSHQRSAQDKVAIISVEGMILEGSGFVKGQIDRAQNDDDVKAVVLRVNSPGGTINGSDYIYHHLRQLAEKTKKPLVVSMGGLAASGGYYISMAVGDAPESIFAEPTTWTGSIGVIIPLFEAADLMDKWGIKEDSITSGPLKEMGSFAKHLTDEERAVFEELVARSFTRFKDIIKKGRPKFDKDPAALDELATGQVFTAEQALDNGLVDKIGFLEEAVDRAIELAGLDKNNVRVVKYSPEPTLASILFDSRVQAPKLELSSLLELGTPRAYFLWTRLPPLIRSGSL